jgi:hypothetical protein
MQRLLATIQKSRNQKEDTNIEPCRVCTQDIVSTRQNIPEWCPDYTTAPLISSNMAVFIRKFADYSTQVTKIAPVNGVELMVESVSSIPPCMPILLIER